MTEPAIPIFRRGELVTLTYGAQTARAMIVLASRDSRSLMLMFDGVIGRYLQMMPIVWDAAHGAYVDLVRHELATLTRDAA